LAVLDSSYILIESKNLEYRHTYQLFFSKLKNRFCRIDNISGFLIMFENATLSRKLELEEVFNSIKRNN
jgi:hypothetical protein